MMSIQERERRSRGFGLIELVVTVAILGVLILVAIPVFGSIQRTAANNVTKSSISQLSTAIELARTKENKALRYITNNTCTMCGFDNGVDPLTVPKGTGGWITYNNSLNAIGKAAGMELKGLVDGYGRPVYLDENEDESGCRKDVLASYKDPYIGRGATDIDNRIDLYTFKC